MARQGRAKRNIFVSSCEILGKRGSGRLGLDLLGIEARLALGPAGRGGGGFAQGLQQHLAPRRADVRQRRRAAERRRQPRPRPRAQQPLVEKTIGGKARQLLGLPLPLRAPARRARAAVAAGGVLRRRRAAADPPGAPQDAAPVAQRSRRHRARLVRARAVLLSGEGGSRSGLS